MTNRDDIFATVSSHYNITETNFNEKCSCVTDICEKLFTRLMYGGSIKGWLTDFKIKIPGSKNLDFVLSFQKEMKSIQKQISNENPDIVALVRTIKGSNENIDSSVTAYYCQILETKVVEQIILCVEDLDLLGPQNIMGYCYDRITLLEEKVAADEESIIEKMQKRVLECTGFNVEIVRKDFDMCYDLSDVVVNNSVVNNLILRQFFDNNIIGAGTLAELFQTLIGTENIK